MSLHIGVVTSELKKSKTYLALPTSLVYSEPPESQPDLWMSFKNKSYYPMGILDENDKLVSLRESMHMTIELIPTSQDVYTSQESPVEPTVRVTDALKGIYWFGAFSAHNTGIYRVRFECPALESKVPPLHLLIPSESDDPASPTPIKRRKAAPIQHDLAVLVSIDEPVVAMEVIEEAKADPIIPNVDPVEPNEVPTAPKRKLEHTKKLKPIKPIKGDSLVLSRPTLPISITSSLVRLQFSPLLSSFLYDDYFQSLTATAEALPRLNILYEPSPTVKEFLTKTKPAYSVWVEQLITLFNRHFETHLLRTEEKQAKVIRSMVTTTRKKKKSYAETFPLIYLVRLLLVLTAVEVDEELVGESEGLVEDLQAALDAVVLQLEQFIRPQISSTSGGSGGGGRGRGV